VQLVLAVFAFALGASIGSFLTVVWFRVPRGLSIVSPPSHCDECERALRWYENIPILSWVIQAGRCRTCGVVIPMRYPLLEAALGMSAALGAILIIS
jgi:leader peptidase (prepilin peptidase) / N-methyltransferase